MEKKLDINNPKDYAYSLYYEQVRILGQFTNEYINKYGKLDENFTLEGNKKVKDNLTKKFKKDCIKFGIITKEKKQEIIDNTLYYACTDLECETIIDFLVNKLGGNVNKKNEITGKSPLDIAAEAIAEDGNGMRRRLNYLIYYLDNSEKDSNFKQLTNNKSCLLI